MQALSILCHIAGGFVLRLVYGYVKRCNVIFRLSALRPKREISDNENANERQKHFYLNCNCKLNTSVKWQQPLTGTVDAQERFLSGGILRLRRRAAAQERLRSDHRELAEPVGCRHRPFVDEGPRLCFPVGLCLEDLRRGRSRFKRRQKWPDLAAGHQIFLIQVTS